jgi:hypothetical protein
MAAADNQKQAFINAARAAANQLWEAEQTLLRLQAEWVALDYGTALDNATDFTGANEGLTREEIDAAVNTTGNAIKTVFDAGNGTNLARVKY